MAKSKKTKISGKISKKKELSQSEKEALRIQRDLKKSRKYDSESIVDEDMRESEFKSKEKIIGVPEVAERPQPEYRGIKLFYGKFVSRLKNALKQD